MAALAHTTVTARGAVVRRWMLFLHGILGSGANWRSIARRFVERRPEWGAALVDLREHGASKGLEPPHRITTAAADLDGVRHVLESDAPVAGVVGHSFGGKVALQWAVQSPASLQALWLIDSNPGARPAPRGSETTVGVVEMLDRLEFPMTSRESFRAQVRREGFGEHVAQWLAMNLERRDDGNYTLGLDLVAIRALLDDYFVTDLWHVVEEPPSGLDVQVVVGGRSTVFESRDLERGRAAAAASAHVRLYLVEEAGHWVHMEAGARLLDLLSEGSP